MNLREEVFELLFFASVSDSMTPLLCAMSCSGGWSFASFLVKFGVGEDPFVKVEGVGAI